MILHVLMIIFSFILGFSLAIVLGRKRRVLQIVESNYIKELLKKHNCDVKNRTLIIFNNKYEMPINCIITNMTKAEDSNVMFLRLGEYYNEIRWNTVECGYGYNKVDLLISENSIVELKNTDSNNCIKSIKISKVEHIRNKIMRAQIMRSVIIGSETRMFYEIKDIPLTELAMYYETAQQGDAPEPPAGRPGDP